MKAARQLRQQERQRILGLIPNFNTTNLPNAAPLFREQKFQLAIRSAVDPVQILGAAILAGISQARYDFTEYGEGSRGYLKRLGAGYAYGFVGTMLGNAVFPSLLHQDPRYFRKRTGSVKARLLYAVSTTVRAKNDNGKWAPNYSNLLGNIAAGVLRICITLPPIGAPVLLLSAPLRLLLKALLARSSQSFGRIFLARYFLNIRLKAWQSIASSDFGEQTTQTALR